MPLPALLTDPQVLRTLAFMGGYGALRADASHVRNQQAEAEMMTEAMRQFQAMRMAETIGNLKLGTAQRLGSGMAKEAFLGKMVGGALTGVGKALTSVGKAGNTFRFEQAARRLGVGAEAAAAKAPGIFSNGTQRFEAAAKNLGLGGAAAAPAAAGGWRNTLRAGGAKLQQAGQQFSAAAAKPSTPPPFQFIDSGMKAKALGVGALAGAGYLGMKGMQATRDFMMAPGHGPAVFGYGSPNPRQGVNEFGY